MNIQTRLHLCVNNMNVGSFSVYVYELRKLSIINPVLIQLACCIATQE